MPEYVALNRRVAGFGSEGGSGGNGSDHDKATGSYAADKFIPNWHELPKAEKNRILKERKRLGIKLGKGGKGGDSVTKSSKGSAPTKAAFNKLKKQNKKFQRRLKALKRKVGDDADDADDDDDDELQDPGDAFGGRESKKQKKKGGG